MWEWACMPLFCVNLSPQWKRFTVTWWSEIEESQSHSLHMTICEITAGGVSRTSYKPFSAWSNYQWKHTKPLIDIWPGSKYKSYLDNRSLECPKVTSCRLQSDLHWANSFQCGCSFHLMLYRWCLHYCNLELHKQLSPTKTDFLNDTGYFFHFINPHRKLVLCI